MIKKRKFIQYNLRKKYVLENLEKEKRVNEEPWIFSLHINLFYFYCFDSCVYLR